MIDTARRQVWCGGASIELRRKEFDLLLYLAARPGRTYSCEQLREIVWASTFRTEPRKTVVTHVERLRRKLEKNPTHPRLLLSAGADGYVFAPAGRADRRRAA